MDGKERGKVGQQSVSGPTNHPQHLAKPSAQGEGALRVSRELCGLGLGLCLDCNWGKALVSYMLPSGKWPQDGSRGSVGSPAQALSPLTPKEPWQSGCRAMQSPPQQEGVRVGVSVHVCAHVWRHVCAQWAHVHVRMSTCTLCVRDCVHVCGCGHEFVWIYTPVCV